MLAPPVSFSLNASASYAVGDGEAFLLYIMEFRACVASFAKTASALPPSERHTIHTLAPK